MLLKQPLHARLNSITSFTIAERRLNGASHAVLRNVKTRSSVPSATCVALRTPSSTSSRASPYLTSSHRNVGARSSVPSAPYSAEYHCVFLHIFIAPGQYHSLREKLPGTPCRSQRHRRQDTLLGAFCPTKLTPCNQLSPESHSTGIPQTAGRGESISFAGFTIADASSQQP